MDPSNHYFFSLLWPAELSDTQFGIPALQGKANFGVCVSGGGMRAASLAYGWVRALHEVSGAFYIGNQPLACMGEGHACDPFVKRRAVSFVITRLNQYQHEHQVRPLKQHSTGRMQWKRTR